MLSKLLSNVGGFSTWLKAGMGQPIKRRGTTTRQKKRPHGMHFGTFRPRKPIPGVYGPGVKREKKKEKGEKNGS